MKKLRKRSRFGIILATIIVGMVLVSCFYMPYDPNAMDITSKYMPPSLQHLFGTDNFGRDLFSRVMEGARTTFFIAISTVGIGAVVGTFIGGITGYIGGVVDEVVMRCNDVLAAFPSILLALIVVSVIGTGKYNIIIALGIVFIPSFARVMRSEFVTQKEQDYVKNARLIGVSHVRVMFVHILPNTLPILGSSIAIGFNNAIVTEAGMSYLGLGVQPPDASLGRMLAEAQTYLFQAPWYAIAPGLMMLLTVLAFQLLVEHK